MITKQVTLLDGATATGAGSAVGVLKLLHKTIQVYGTFTATVEVEGSADGTNWFSLGSLTEAGKIAINDAWAFIRGNVTAYTSGTINAKLVAIE